MIAEIKYKLVEYCISIKINTCRFIHKKNSDYPNHIANSVLPSNPELLEYIVYLVVLFILKHLKFFPSKNPKHFNH